MKISSFLDRHRLDALFLCTFAATLLASIITRRQDQDIDRRWELKQAKEEEVRRLIDLSLQYPDYRDLLYRLAVAQWELGNTDEAAEAIARARYLDPNNPSLQRLETQLKPETSQ